MPARLVAALGLCALLAGCAICDYPLITDDRGDYSGIIRTGHKAYIVPSMQAAIIWPDGSDELFTLVYQSAYGDQRLWTFNNFDPTATAIFLDQTYCDWSFEECAAMRCWNPVQNDVVFDYELYATECPGARSVEFLIAADRIGECGDRLGFRGNLQEMAEVFASLHTTTWRGERAYQLPLDATKLSVSIESMAGAIEEMPIFGRYEFLVTERLQLVAPMTPNARHQRRWALNWVAKHGEEARVRYQYRGIAAEHRVRFRPDGLAYNLSRY